MRPHPAFAEADIPRRERLGPFVLRALALDDLDEDFAALRESEETLAQLQNHGFPRGITREEDALELAWHQVEFRTRRSFAWVIADGLTDAYLGCAYVYPEWDAEGPLDAWWWFRDAESGRPEAKAFGALFEAWLTGPPWPRLQVLMTPPPG